MSKGPKIIVAIPCYNCEKQIPRVIKGFSRSLLSKIEEVIIINNRSEDGTLDAAREAIKQNGSKKFSIFTNKKNYSLGGSHKVAFLYAENKKADYIAILHGDDQARTSELIDLIKETELNPKAEAILGSRFLKKSKLEGYSIERILGNKALNVIYSVITLRKTSDLGSGINLFKIEPLRDHRYLGFGDNITFNIDLLLDYFRKKSKLVFFPISWSETDQVSNAKNFEVATTALRKLFRWRFGREKLLKRNPKDYVSAKERLIT